MTPEAVRNGLIQAEEPARSHDAHDVLMADVVSRDLDDYGIATHVIIGCPQDIGVQRNHGRPGAAKAPAAIRQALYRLKPPAESTSVRLLDVGDVAPVDDLDAMHDALHEVVRHALADGKKVMVLGGGNDISLPDAKAVSAVHPGFTAINMDAHLDMRKSDVIHSGTPYRNLIDGGHLAPENFHETGIQPWANAPHYLEDARSMGVNIHTLADIERVGEDAFFDSLFTGLDGKPLFAGLDMDSVRASDAPGVSAPSPVGFSVRGILGFAARCHEHGQTAVFEITEVNPDLDVDGRTARLAALALYFYMFGAC